MHGLHLTADLHGCAPPDPRLMWDSAALRAQCLAAVAAAGLQAVGDLFHGFAPGPAQAQPAGVTGVVLLAESHLAVHTWPELGAVTLDVYVCNLGADNSGAARELLAQLELAFGPSHCEHGQLWRGAVAAPGRGREARPTAQVLDPHQEDAVGH